MSLLSSILLGFIQGLTEFLPVSSSGHLAIAEHLLGMSGASDIPEFFDVLLHLGTLVAVFVAYWAEVRDMVLEFFRGAKDLAHGTTPTPIPPARRMILLIIVGTLPLFVVLPIKDFVEGLADNMYFVGGDYFKNYGIQPAACCLPVTGFARDIRVSVPPESRMCWWWVWRRPSRPAPVFPALAPPLPPAALWALTANLPCAIPSSCPFPPFWAPTSSA